LKVFYVCLVVVIPLAVIPWRYVTTHYVTKPGDPWRCKVSTNPATQSLTPPTQHLNSSPPRGPEVFPGPTTAGPPVPRYAEGA
jgi:hypothetical protein